ncbi:MAG TPA: YeeE/YedE family protein [Arenibaculum sp.]|nr:YeeE/YedE family protein [Arenibaculum sp.]
MRTIPSALASGLLFGLGLIVSGMIDPAKVLGFLDVAGAWDPTLLFVMGGAMIVAFVGYRHVLRRPAPLFAARFELPTRRDIDDRLVVGAALFGIGWGLAGFCPGPALTALAVEPAKAGVFVGAMLAGMLLHRLVPRPRQSGKPA